MQPDYFMLTLKALEHPHGLTILDTVRELRQEVKTDVKPNPLLKIEAYNIAKRLGIRIPRHINQMTEGELLIWINQHSA